MRDPLRSAWGKVWLPYQIVPMGHGNLFMPVNRHYKPLGMKVDEFVIYEDNMDRAVRIPTGARYFPRFCINSGLYLYSDDPETHKTYFERLAKITSYFA